MALDMAWHSLLEQAQDLQLAKLGAQRRQLMVALQHLGAPQVSRISPSDAASAGRPGTCAHCMSHLSLHSTGSLLAQHSHFLLLLRQQCAGTPAHAGQKHGWHVSHAARGSTPASSIAVMCMRSGRHYCMSSQNMRSRGELLQHTPNNRV